MAALPGCYTVTPGTCNALDCAPPCTNTEFTMAIDSRNRDRCAYPEANPVALDLKASPQKIPTCLFSLGSLEFPISQGVIEKEWSRVYFDEGFRAAVDISATTAIATPTLAVREYVVSDPDVLASPVTVLIPMYLNPIVEIALVAGTTYEFTTFWPHGLGDAGLGSAVADVYAQFPVPAPMRVLLGGSQNQAEDVVSQNPTLNVTGATTFTLDYAGALAVPVVAGPTAFPPAHLGFLHAPAVPSGSSLVQVMNAALAEPSTGLGALFSWSYDASTNRFTFTRFGVPTAPGAPTLQNVDAYSLLSALGYGLGTLTLRQTRTQANQYCMPSQCNQRRGETVSRYEVTSSQPRCAGYVEVPPCNYSASDLGAQLQFEFNRFYLGCACSNEGDENPAPVAATFVWSNECGACTPISVPCGMYTPEQLAALLEDAMNSTAAPGNTYSVTYDRTTEQFVFSALNQGGNPLGFGLEFGVDLLGTGVPTDTLHPRLGFETRCYRGASTYRSAMPAHAPDVVCPSDAVPGASHQARSVYTWQQDACQNRYEVSTCKVSCITIDAVSMTQAGGAGTDVTVVLTRPMGWQECDLVHFFAQGGATTPSTTLHVTDVAFTFGAPSTWTYTLDGNGFDLAAFTPMGATSYCLCTDGVPVFNLHFYEPSCGMRSKNYSVKPERAIKPELVGFEKGTYEYASEINPLYADDAAFVSPTLVAPNAHSVKRPDYLLMVVDDPKSSQLMQHQWDCETIPDVFAKIVLYPEFRVERLYPMRATFAGNASVSTMKFTFLNPDHSLYQLHGRNWSATLTFGTPIAQARLTCY